MGKIIVFANQKGGVAKTTSTHNIGVALSKQGKKVLLIDFDSQASLTISLGIEPNKINSIVSALKKNGTPIKECINKKDANLFIITSSIELASIEMDLMARASRERILYRVLEPVINDFDYILIDCPPQLSILTINALSCGDYVIIPVKTDYLAYRGLELLSESIDEIKNLINPKLKVLGIIATFFELRVKDDNDIVNFLKKEYPVLGIIKKQATVKKGVYSGASVLETDAKSNVATEYIKIANIIIEKECDLS